MGSTNLTHESAHQILPGLWIGNQAVSQSSLFMQTNKIGVVVNATKHIPSKFVGAIYYLRVPIDDPGSNARADNSDVRIMRWALKEVIGTIEIAMAKNMNVLVHCHAGAQRSAIIIVAFLIHRGMTFDDAVKYLVDRRPIAFFGGTSINFKEVFTVI